MIWEVLDTGRRSAEENMAIDRKLLEELSSDGKPILHFYDWEGESATHGYFLKPEEFLDLENAEKWGLKLARRPTGGGVTFHVTDLAFSVLVPANFPHFSLNTMENYLYINSAVKRAVEHFLSESGISQLLSVETPGRDEHCAHFCMAKATKYDVMIQGRKVAGAAQRRLKQGYLHQGSISIGMPKSDFLDQVLLPDTLVHQAMKENTFSLLGDSWVKSDIEEARHQLKQNLKRYLT